MVKAQARLLLFFHLALEERVADPGYNQEQHMWEGLAILSIPSWSFTSIEKRYFIIPSPVSLLVLAIWSFFIDIHTDAPIGP